MLYRLFGWWFRWQACKLAALAFSRHEPDGEGICPRLWSTTVFFETYMLEGASNTLEDFGPKQPVELKAVNE